MSQITIHSSRNCTEKENHQRIRLINQVRYEEAHPLLCTALYRWIRYKELHVVELGWWCGKYFIHYTKAGVDSARLVADAWRRSSLTTFARASGFTPSSHKLTYEWEGGRGTVRWEHLPHCIMYYIWVISMGIKHNNRSWNCTTYQNIYRFPVQAAIENVRNIVQNWKNNKDIFNCCV